jgi:hypothetical protein
MIWLVCIVGYSCFVSMHKDVGGRTKARSKLQVGLGKAGF